MSVEQKGLVSKSKTDDTNLDYKDASYILVLFCNIEYKQLLKKLTGLGALKQEINKNSTQ